MMYASADNLMYMGGGFFYDGENEIYDPAMAASMGYADAPAAQAPSTSYSAPAPYMGEGASVTQPSYSSTPPMNVLKVGDQYWSADTVDQLQPGMWVNINGQYQVFDPNNVNVVSFPQWFEQVYGRPYAGEDPAGVLGGLRTAITQDQIDNQSGTEGFMTETFPLLAAGAITGGMVGSVANAANTATTAGVDPNLYAGTAPLTDVPTVPYEVPPLDSPSWVTDLLNQTGEAMVDPATLEGGFNPSFNLANAVPTIPAPTPPTTPSLNTLASGASLAGTAANLGTKLADGSDLNELLAQTGELGVDPATLEGGYVNPAVALDTPSWVKDLLNQTGEYALSPSQVESGANPSGFNPLDYPSLPKIDATTKSSLAKILDGTATADDWLKALGAIAPSALGMYASNQQSDALKELAAQQMAAEQSRFDTLMKRQDAEIARRDAAIEAAKAIGAPYRDKLAGYTSDPNSYYRSPEVTGAVDFGMNSLARALSAKVGNPIENMSALGEMTRYGANSLWDKYSGYMGQLAGWGGIPSYGAAGATVPGITQGLSQNVQNSGSGAATSAIGADSNFWNALGAGAANLFNPPKSYSLEQLLASNNIFGSRS